MDSVNSAFQLAAARDVQVTITGASCDPLRIAFDKSQAYAVRNALFSQLSSSSSTNRHGGVFFCFDYLGDDFRKAGLLPFEASFAAQQPKPAVSGLQATAEAKKNREIAIACRQADSAIADGPSTKGRNSTEVRGPENAHVRHQKPLYQSQPFETTKAQTSFESMVTDPVITFGRLPSGTADFRGRLGSTHSGTTTGSGQITNLQVDSGVDQPNKPHQVVKISNVLQSNLLSDRRKRQFTQLQTADVTMSSKKPVLVNKSIESKRRQNNLEPAKVAQNRAQKSSPSLHKKENAEESSKKDASSMARVDFADPPNPNKSTEHLSKRSKVSFTGQSRLESQNIYEGQGSSVQKLSSSGYSCQQNLQDDELLTALQQTMQRKYLAATSDSKKWLLKAEHSIPSVRDSQVVLTTDRPWHGTNSGSEHKVMHSDRVLTASPKATGDNSLERHYLLHNLKLLEKEVGLLQSKSAINRQEERYLNQVYDRLSDVQNRLSLLDPANDSLDGLPLAGSQKGRSENKLDGQAAAYNPHFSSIDEDLPRLDKPQPKAYAPLSIQTGGLANGLFEERESSTGIANLFRKKTSKVSKPSFPESAVSKPQSTKTQKSSFTGNSEFYEKQMNKSRLRQLRLEAKRQAQTEVERSQCTFAPKPRRRQPSTEA